MRAELHKTCSTTVNRGRILTTGNSLTCIPLSASFPPFSQRTRTLQEHFFPETGALLHHVQINYVGKLEKIDRDWPALCTNVLGLPESTCRMDPTIGRHPSSEEGKKWTPVNQHTLSESPSALQALCLILLPDFACFGYPLPRTCVGVVHQLEKEYLAAHAIYV